MHSNNVKNAVNQLIGLCGQQVLTNVNVIGVHFHTQTTNRLFLNVMFKGAPHSCIMNCILLSNNNWYITDIHFFGATGLSTNLPRWSDRLIQI